MPDGKGMSVGGIQTYLMNLSKIAISLGIEVFIYQAANIDFEAKVEGVTVKGFKCNPKRAHIILTNKCVKEMDRASDLLLFGTDSFICKIPKDIKSIAIQHGVYWDKPERVGCSSYIYFLDYCYQAYKDWKTIKRTEMVNKLICVDYNYINWYRSQVAYPKVDIIAIPNFTEIGNEANINKHSTPKTIKILFARRFFEYRGTRLFANAISRILDEYSNVEVTLAGSGPDERWLKNRLNKYSNIRFTKYESSESLRVHADKHIAIVPTMGSEGTSLSLLEAMSSQCAVICTNVGGMTNVVIDRYNGIMISPNEEDLYLAIKELVDDEKLRNTIARNGYDTIKCSYSIDAWSEKWKKILMSTNLAEK